MHFCHFLKSNYCFLIGLSLRCFEISVALEIILLKVQCLLIYDLDSFHTNKNTKENNTISIQRNNAYTSVLLNVNFVLL